MGRFVIKIKHQKTRSYARRVLPITIVCCSVGNHIHLAGASLSVIMVAVYLFALLIDITTKRVSKTDGLMNTFGGIRLKRIVYIWIGYGIIQTGFLYLINSDLYVFSELLSYIINLVLLLSIIRFTEDDDDLKRYSFLIVLCTVIELLICHYELSTGNHIRATTFRHYRMVFGTYYNENDLSVMLALGSLTTFYYGFFVKDRRILKYLVVAAVLADCIYMILFTRSRGGQIGYIIAVVLILISVLFGRNYNIYRVLYKISLALIVMLILVIALTGQISVTDENDLARMRIYNGVVTLFSSKPITLLFGAGAGQLKASIGYAVHNYILQVLGDFGLVGVFSYLYIIISMLKMPNIYHASIRDSVRKTSVITCALLTVFFGFVVSDYGAIKLSWILLGLFYAESLVSKAAKVEDKMSDFGK